MVRHPVMPGENRKAGSQRAAATRGDCRSEQMVKPSRDCVSVRVILREGYSRLGEVGNPEHFWCSLKLLDMKFYWLAILSRPLIKTNGH